MSYSNKEYGVSDNICPNCGAKMLLDDDKMVCKYCGYEIYKNKTESYFEFNDDYYLDEDDLEESYDYCNIPTRPLVSYNSNPRKKEGKSDRSTALLLCVFFGLFGAHKFYEKKKKWGWIYLCTLGLFGLGIIVDCVILCNKDEFY